MDYVECIQAQVVNLTWAEQVKNGETQSPSLSYTTVKNAILVIASMEPIVEPMHVPHAAEADNETIPQGLEPLVIPYQTNQPIDPQLWDSNFCSISLFGIDEFLARDTKDITCSLLRMAVFIK